MNLRTTLCLAALTLAVSTPAQDVGYLIDEGEKFEKLLKEEEAFQKYREAVKLSPSRAHPRQECRDELHPRHAAVR